LTKNGRAIFLSKKAARKLIANYSDKLDLRPISNNQAVVVDGDRIETLTAEKKGKKSAV
jgi:dipeptidase E